MLEIRKGTDKFYIGDNEEKRLQVFLDRWCEDNKQRTTTYYVDFKIGILL